MLNILNRGSLVPYRWSSTLQLYLRSPRKDIVCFLLVPISSINIKGKKTHTSVISLSPMGLLNLSNGWIPLPTK